MCGDLIEEWLHESNNDVLLLNMGNRSEEKAKELIIEIFDISSDHCWGKVCDVKCYYSEATTLNELFEDLGFDSQIFNVLDDKNEIRWIQIPYYDNGEEIIWEMDYDTAMVDAYLEYYKCSSIRINPFNDRDAGIGDDIGPLLFEIYTAVKSFLLEHPVLSGVFSNIICELVKKGYKKAIEFIGSLEKRRATYPAIMEHLETKESWQEGELMKKYKIDSPESLEYLMFGFGYVKNNGEYRKYKDSQ